MCCNSECTLRKLVNLIGDDKNTDLILFACFFINWDVYNGKRNRDELKNIRDAGGSILCK